jgi:hypothetical protein
MIFVTNALRLLLIVEECQIMLNCQYLFASYDMTTSHWLPLYRLDPMVHIAIVVLPLDPRGQLSDRCSHIRKVVTIARYH